jgi:hypothetical protein
MLLGVSKEPDCRVQQPRSTEVEYRDLPSLVADSVLRVSREQVLIFCQHLSLHEWLYLDLGHDATQMVIRDRWNDWKEENEQK